MSDMQLRKKLSNTKQPHNAERLFNIVDKMNTLKLEADRLLVKLSYETIASMILGEANLDTYKERAEKIVDELYALKKLADRELPMEEGEYEEFYYTIEMIIDDYGSQSADLIIDMNDMSEDGKDILRIANQAATINEFKRFS